MSGVLPPEDIELIPSFFAHNQHVYGPVFFRDIVQDTKIAEAKFPRRQRIEPQVLIGRSAAWSAHEPSNQTAAAVDREGRSRDEPVAHQKDHGLSDFLRLADTPDRQLAAAGEDRLALRSESVPERSFD